MSVRQDGRNLAPFQKDVSAIDVANHLRNQLVDAATVVDGTTASSQATGNGAYDVNTNIGLFNAIVDGRVATEAAAVDFDVDNDANAVLWPGFYNPGAAGAGFNLVIVGGVNAMDADIVITEADIPVGTHLDMQALATVIAAKINAIANGGAGTVTVVALTGVFIITSAAATAITVAVPDGAAADWTTILFGGTADQDAGATIWKGQVPNPYDGETIDYGVVSRKDGGGSIETIVAESAPYLDNASPGTKLTRAEINKAVGSGDWAGIALIKVTRDGDASLALNIDRNFQAFGFFLPGD